MRVAAPLAAVFAPYGQAPATTEGQIPRPQLVQRARVLMLLLLFSALSYVAVEEAANDLSLSPLTLIAMTGQLALCAGFLLVYRRQRLSLPMEMGLLLAASAAMLTDTNDATNILFGLATTRALYSCRGRLPLLPLYGVAGVIGPAVAGHGVAPMLTVLPIAALVGGFLHLLHRTLVSHENIAHGERIMNHTAPRLLAATGREEVLAAAANAVGALCRENGWWYAVAVPAGERVELLFTGGVRPPVAAGPADPGADLPPFSQPLFRDSTATETLRLPASASRRWNAQTATVLPLRSLGNRVGALLIGSGAPLPVDVVRMIETLVATTLIALQRCRSEALVRTVSEQRTALIGRLVRAQEEERSRVPADIHDDTIQVIAALRMSLIGIASRAVLPETRERLTSAAREAAGAITRLRTLMFGLRPVSLDRGGVGAAIREHLADLEGGGAGEWPEVVVEDEIEDLPGPEIGTVLFRVAQEALSNARKHANAQHVRVRLRQSDGGYCVTVRDDGDGFDASGGATSPRGHVGLTSMRERAAVVGGSCSILSTPGDGTIVSVWVPSSASDAYRAALGVRIAS